MASRFTYTDVDIFRAILAAQEEGIPTQRAVATLLHVGPPGLHKRLHDLAERGLVAFDPLRLLPGAIVHARADVNVKFDVWMRGDVLVGRRAAGL